MPRTPEESHVKTASVVLSVAFVGQPVVLSANPSLRGQRCRAEPPDQDACLKHSKLAAGTEGAVA